MPATEKFEPLSLQENTLATAMLRRVGNAATSYVMRDGVRVHQHDQVDEEQFTTLVNTYRDDPKELLAHARDSLFAIGHDQRQTAEQRSDRLDRYLDAYFDLIIKLDHASFPNTEQGRVMSGVREYIPDGFIDMGKDHVLNPKARNREQLWVDKRAIFDDNKDVLKEIIMSIPPEFTTTQRKERIVELLAYKIHFQMRPGQEFDDDQIGNQGDKIKLSEISEGICRHQSLLFQVLAQAMGVQSRIVKSGINGNRHVSNAVRVNGSWWMVDVSNPDYEKLENGNTEWRFGPMKIDRPPQPGEIKQYDLQMRHSGKKWLYTADDRSYWRIEHV